MSMHNQKSLSTSASTQLTLDLPRRKVQIGRTFDEHQDVSFYNGSCVDMLQQMPDGVADLVVTSPPYNLGKEYERKRLNLDS